LACVSDWCGWVAVWVFVSAGALGLTGLFAKRTRTHATEAIKRQRVAKATAAVQETGAKKGGK
jgi:hypothetical protein